MGYIPGDFWRIDDRSGFKVRASRTRKEWTGDIVSTKSWEARHPQDYVRGRPDDQTVPDPRPRPADASQGNAFTVTTAAASAGAYIITVSSSSGFVGEGLIRVMLDSGEAALIQLFSIDGNTFSLLTPLPGSVAEGATVTYVSTGPAWINLDFSETFNSHWA